MSETRQSDHRRERRVEDSRERRVEDSRERRVDDSRQRRAGDSHEPLGVDGHEPRTDDIGEHLAQRRSIRLRRTKIGVVIAATVISVLAVLLVAAAWRDDMLITSNKGVASAEVLSAGRLRSAITYVTPDGVTHNPKVGVLYPTKLTAGERINVEYSKNDPELVRVAGRDASVAIVPALSVIVVVWLVALPVLWLLRRWQRRGPRPKGTAAAGPWPE